ncbi:MAG TPA: tripartite tricarboxylate transporter substrate binding protein [Burkholderiaceae bacterium]|nr:tripartite tricarboxylate transporter substrate binding protein [Burkholderiaceae bacterium]
MKRSLFIAACLAALALPLSAGAQTDWPQKPVTMVVPYPPGGVNDAVARAYANKLAIELGKPILIDNRAGAGTTVASNYVAKAPADGYIIYAGGTSLVINPTLTGQVQYDPHKSFDLVSLMSFTPFILHVNSEFPARNMAELIAHAKANPGKFNIASSGIGATNHLIAELLKMQTGINMTHVPYKGGAQAGQDVASGQAQMMFSAALEARPVMATGKTRPIAITSAERSPAFPDIPTVAEATGMKDFVVVFWQGMVVPAGTPRAIVDKLEKAIAKVAADPEMIERFKPQGVEIRASSQAEFKDYMNKEEARWTKLIKERNIKPE